MEPGFYLHLPEDDHHRIDALHKTGVKQLLISPSEFWGNRPSNHDREKKSTPDQIMGSARHCLMFEGPEKFEKRYASEFSRVSHPDALTTIESLVVWISSKGEKPIKGTKSVLIEQALAIDPSVEILDVLVESHRAANIGKTMLPPDIWRSVASSSLYFDFVRSRLLGTGFPEVTAVWNDEELGVLCAARFDWIGISPEGHGRIVDLKDFQMQGRKITLKARTDQVFTYERQDIDVSFYLRALRETPVVVHDSARKAEHETMIARVRDTWPQFPPQNHPEFVMLYYRKDGPLPEFVPRSIQTADSSGALNDVGSNSYAAIKLAASIYRDYRESHGPDKPWLQPWKVQALDASELPSTYAYL